jgi:hypothetical protein
MNPWFFRDFIHSLVGGLPGQRAPIFERLSDVTNPTFLLALDESMSRAHLGGAVVRYAAIGVLFASSAWAMRRFQMNGMDDVRLFSMGALFLLLLMPRVKPYSLPYAVPPIFLLAQGTPRRIQVGALLISVWVPGLLFNKRIMTLAMQMVSGPVQVWISANQMGCVFLCALLFSAHYLGANGSKPQSPVDVRPVL